MDRQRVILITGAGRGTGAAAEAVVNDITACGGSSAAVQADVSKEADVVRLSETCDRTLGTPRALVNNAGVLDLQMRVEAMTADRIARVLATNVLGTILCAREAVRRMSTRRGGTGGAIVNVSSGAARLGSPGEYVDYAASKGAVDTAGAGNSLSS